MVSRRVPVSPAVSGCARTYSGRRPGPGRGHTGPSGPVSVAVTGPVGCVGRGRDLPVPPGCRAVGAASPSRVVRPRDDDAAVAPSRPAPWLATSPRPDRCHLPDARPRPDRGPPCEPHRRPGVGTCRDRLRRTNNAAVTHEGLDVVLTWQLTCARAMLSASAARAATAHESAPSPNPCPLPPQWPHPRRSRSCCPPDHTAERGRSDGSLSKATDGRRLDVPGARHQGRGREGAGADDASEGSRDTSPCNGVAGPVTSWPDIWLE
jgi:hypothetical protein